MRQFFNQCPRISTLWCAGLIIAFQLTASGCGSCSSDGGIEPDGMTATCGNGALDTGEECDTGELRSDTIANECRLDCRLPYCGDGVVDLGEECEAALSSECAASCRVDVTGFLDLRLSAEMPPTSPDSVHQMIPVGDTGKVLMSALGAGRSSELFIVDADGSNRRRLGPVLSDGARISNVVVAASQQRVLYLSDYASRGYLELYSVRTDGTGLVRLNPQLVAGGQVSSFGLSPDETRVIYLAQVETFGQTELFTVGLDGTENLKLSGLLPEDGDVIAHHSQYDHSVRPRFTSDSSRVVFLANGADGAWELFAVDVDGGNLLTISGAMVTGGQVGVGTSAWTYEVAPDGSGVVYLADQETDGVMELFYVNLDGTGLRKINQALPDSTSIGCGSFSSGSCGFSSSGVFVYYGGYGAAGERDAFAANIAAETLINLTEGTAHGPLLESVVLTPDGTRAVYKADEELHSIGLDGSNHVVVVNSVVDGGGIRRQYRITPDSSRVLFAGDLRVDGARQVYAAALDGSGVIELTDVPADGLVASVFDISADSTEVLLQARDSADEPNGLFVATTDGSSLIRITTTTWPMDANGVSRYGWGTTADGSRAVLFAADQTEVARNEPMSVERPWDAPFSLLPDLVSASDVSTYTSTPDSAHWAYVSGPLSQLHVVGSDGKDDVMLEAFTSGSPYQGFVVHFSPDSSRIVYEANGTGIGIRLFSSTLDGVTSVKIGPDADTNSAYRARFTPDSQRILYFEYNDGAGNLISSRLDGTQQVQLNTDLVAGGRVRVVNEASCQVASDSSQVAYVSDEAVDGEHNLYAVNPDGTNHLKISTDGGGVHAGNWLNYQFTPDDSRVVYVAQHDTAGVDELYTAALDGTSVTKLNAALVTGGEVAGELYGDGFKISPDSTKAVYLADQDVAGVNELYSVNIDGTGHAKLNGPIVDGGTIAWVTDAFMISRDSTRVIYQASQDSPGTQELYSARLDGTAQVKLSGTMSSGGNVAYTGYRISSNSQYVVYRADQEVNEKFELFAVRLDGSDRHALTALPADRDVGDFAIMNDSTVIFLADGDTDEVVELYRVSIDGTGLQRLNPALPAGRTITDFAVQPDESAVVFRADPLVHGVFELFSVTLP